MAVKIVAKTGSFPVSKEEATTKFTALGADWWKPFYDGKYHHLGPQVFDRGLHKKHVEPGFYQSLMKAFFFAKDHLCEKLSVQFYKDLNRIACGHFQGTKTDTKMEAKDAGRFRKFDEHETCLIGLGDFLKIHEPGKELVIDEYVKVKLQLGSTPPKEDQQNLTVSDYQYFMEAADLHFKNLDNYIKQLDKDPILKDKTPVVKLWFDFKIFYNEISKEGKWNYDDTIEALFEEFNRNIAAAESAQEKKRLIADLFQKVEFLHPYIDGQGRTDLLLLAWLLASHGLDLALFYDPYVSTYTTLDNWVANLDQGMENWKKAVKSNEI